MRAIKITGLILVLAFGVYTALWYINGKANLRQVETWMGQLAQNPNIKAMSYDSLSLKGFPFGIKVVIDKPKAVIDTRTLITTLMMMSKSQAKPPQVGELHFYSDGAFVIEAGVLGGHYKLLTEGDFLSSLKTDTSEFLFKTTSATDSIGIELNTMDALTKYRNLEQLAAYKADDLDPQIFAALELAGLHDYANWLTEVTKLQFLGKDVKVLDGKNDQLLYSIDKYEYSISHDDLSEKEIMIGLLFDFKNMNATQAYMDKMDHIMKAMGIDNVSKQSVASYQNSDMHFKVKYQGPNSRSFEKPDGDAKLDMEIGVNNNLYHYDNQGKIHATFDNGEFVDLNVDIGDDIEFKPDSHKHMLQMYSELLNEIDAEIKSAAKKRQTGSPLYDNATANPLDDGTIIAFLQDNLETWAPNFEELGKIQGNLKLYAKQLGSMVINLNIKDVSFINQLYGVALDGTLKASMMMPIPTGEVNLNMTDYDVMLNRGQKYVDLLIKYYESQQTPAPMYLDEKLIPRVKEFMSALAEDGKAKDLLIKTKFTTAEPFVLVGGKSQDEIMALFMQIFPPPPPPPAPPQEPTVSLESPLSDSETVSAPMESMATPEPAPEMAAEPAMDMAPEASDIAIEAPADVELTDEQIMELAPEQPMDMSVEPNMPNPME